MERKDIDWGNLGFGYVQTDMRYVSNFRNGQWDDGCLTDQATITMSECACVLQYAQTCFEGLKAYTTEDGYYVFEVYIVTDRYIYQAELRFLSSLMSQYSMYTSYLENSFVANELYQG